MTYLSQYVLDTRPNFEAISHGEVNDFVFDSVGHGLSTPWKATGKLKRKLRLPFIFETAEEVSDFRVFVQDRDGRRLGFWLPVYVNDYRLTADASAGASTITIEDCGLADRFAEGNQFKHLALITRSKLECYGISGVSASGGVETITLESTLDTALTASETICCPLLWVRFSEDEIEYFFENESVSKANVTFAELPGEVLAPDGSGTVLSGSRPVWLYKLVKGGTTYRWANYGNDFNDANTETWESADITHEAIRHGVDFVSDGVRVTIKTDDSAHPLRSYLSRLHHETATLSIYLSDADTNAVTESAPIHSGRVEDVSFGADGQIILDVSSLFRIGEHKAPRIQVIRTCNHRTFDAGCGLVEATFTTAGTISAINTSPPWVEASAFGTKATAESDDYWFALGKVTVGNEVRMCVGVDTSNLNRLYLNAPFQEAAVSDSISAVAGDNKRIATCRDKFNNLENFLGFPYVPANNPQFKALEAPKPSGGKK